MEQTPAHVPSETIRRVVEEAIAAQLDHRLIGTWKKNGHSWSHWFGTFLSPDRAAAIVVTLLLGAVGVGMYLERRDRQLTDAFRDSQIAVVSVQAVEQHLRDEVARLQSVIDSGQQMTADEVALIRNEISLAVTRVEFNAAIRQQILPRLDRIEKSLQE